MDILNAIARVRFASARPQRVQLCKSDPLPIDLLCLEPGQRLKVAGRGRVYYVMAGSARLEAGKIASDLPAGQLAVLDDGEPHTLEAKGEQRLVCLAIGGA